MKAPLSSLNLTCPVLPNAFTRKYGEMAPLGYPAIHHLTSGLRRAKV